MSKSDERWIPAEPEYRAGLYKDISQVPDHLRLQNFKSRFKGRDCWREYVEENDLLSDDLSDNHQRYVKRTGRRWKSFVQDRGTHHAQCEPEDANEYARFLIEEYSLKPATAGDYWADIERFYRWMFYNAEFPLRYHPFAMAAVSYEMSRELWFESVQLEVR